MKRPDPFRLQDCSSLLSLSLHLEKLSEAVKKSSACIHCQFSHFTKLIITIHLHLHRFLNSFRKSYVSDLVPTIAERVTRCVCSTLSSHQCSSRHLMLWIPHASLAALMARTIWMFRFSLSCVKSVVEILWKVLVALQVWIRDLEVIFYLHTKSIYLCIWKSELIEGLLISPWRACLGWFSQSRSS